MNREAILSERLWALLKLLAKKDVVTEAEFVAKLFSLAG